MQLICPPEHKNYREGYTISSTAARELQGQRRELQGNNQHAVCHIQAQELKIVPNQLYHAIARQAGALVP